MDALASILKSIKESIPPIHREGHIFALIFLVISIFAAMLWWPLGWVFGIITVWCLYFFRDPVRMVPQGEGLIVSPADGVVSDIREVVAPAEAMMEGDETYTRVSIFLNVFNVHINRMPIGGVIKRSHYHPGKFFNATLDKASEENERQLYVVETKEGQDIIFVQIAGLIARRILSFVKEGEMTSTGQRFGLIRFGSRMDVYLPKGVAPQVAIGQTMIGGETLIADLKSKKKTLPEFIQE